MGGKRVAKPATSAAVAAEPAEKKSHKAVWIVLLVLVLLLAGAVAGVCVYANGYDTVFPGVKLGGEPLEGLTKSELAQRVSADELLQGTVTITANGLELGKYTQEQLGAKVETEALTEAAWGVGRETGILGWLKNGLTLVKGYLGSENVVTVAVGGYDEAVLRQTAAALAAEFDREPVNSSYELREDGFFVVKPSDGQALDQEGLVEALSAMDGSPGDVEAPWKTVEAQPLDLKAISEELNVEALPARYDIESGKVVDGQVGVSIDPDAAALVLESAVPGETVQLPADIIYPEMTAEQLQAVLFRDVLGTATTSVSGTTARKGNVRLAGECVNGTILNDGDVFDYNQVVGERTTARGFGAAATYVNGETVDTVGGGICQVSSTVYLACLNSNLEIVERHNHRFFPGYITLGMDATVSWGGPEFRFKNNTGYPVRIDVTYEGGKLTVKFVGTNVDGTYVKMTYKELSSTPYETVYENTDSLPYGTQQQKQSGYTGHKVETYRNVYSADGKLISSDLEAVSNYSKRDRIILVGTNGQPAAPTGGDATVPSGGETATPGGETASPGTETPSGGETTSPGTEAPSGGETTDPGADTTEPDTDDGSIPDDVPDWLF